MVCLPDENRLDKSIHTMSGVGELQENFWKLNGLCQKYHYMWFIEYRYYDKEYIGKIDSGNVNGQLAYITAEYLDDLVEKMVSAIELHISPRYDP